MKRYFLCLVVAAAAAASSGCGPKGPPEASQTATTESRMASRVRTGDPRAAQQLVSGFYAIENGAWRWTARKFEVELGVPAGAASAGAVLECRFNMPPASVEKLKSQTLTASIGGEALKPATLDTAGLFTYSREIPANLLTGPAIKVAFELDKALKPDNGDARELGVVASEFWLKPR